MDGLGDVRCFAVVVQGDKDGSGIMKSCFIVIVVNMTWWGQGRGRSEPDCLEEL